MMKVPAEVSTRACRGRLWASNVSLTIRLKPDPTRVPATDVHLEVASGFGWLRTGPAAIRSSAITSRFGRRWSRGMGSGRRIDDSRGVADVVKARDERDRERRIHEQIDDDGMIAEVIEEQRCHRR